MRKHQPERGCSRSEQCKRCDSYETPSTRIPELISWTLRLRHRFPTSSDSNEPRCRPNPKRERLTPNFLWLMPNSTKVARSGLSAICLKHSSYGIKRERPSRRRATDEASLNH